jgi:pimeloyl-ACP methyl ester carboxylesterase
MTRPEEDADPEEDRAGDVHTVRRPDGSEIRIECYGPADALLIVWTHGWGTDSTEWFYQKRYLTDRFRMIVWDLPGLGLSKKPDNNDYRLEKLAADLDTVLASAGDRPALVVGHSIGGMIALTYCKNFPEMLKARVAGLVLVHTSYTNPVRTTRMAGLYSAIEKPVLIPLLYVTIALWPLVWAMNWLSYFNGSMHRSTHKSSFSGHETRGQLDFGARFGPHGRPDVLARGMLGMIAYDAAAVLGAIDVPTLVVVGDEDTMTTPEAGEFIARHIPGAELVTLAPARHMGFLEHHGRFDRIVAEFAASCRSIPAARAR